MVPLSEDWQFCLGWRAKSEARGVSTARMNPQYEGGAIAVANVTAGFEKVVKRISEFCTTTKTPAEIREVSGSTEFWGSRNSIKSARIFSSATYVAI